MQFEGSFEGHQHSTSDDYLIECFKLDCEVRNLSEKTIDGYLSMLRWVREYLGQRKLTLTSVTKPDIRQHILELRRRGMAIPSINSRLRVLRLFYRFLKREGLMDGDLPMDGISLLRAPKKVKPVIKPEELQQVLRRADKTTFEGQRNIVFCLLLFDGMLRLSEALSLTLDNVKLHEGMVKVMGKGRKERWAPIGQKTARFISRYMLKHRRHIPGEYLICMRNSLPIKHRRGHRIIVQMGLKADVKMSPHLLRHSGATYYARSGGNLEVLRRILGHSSLLVTQNYLHMSAEDAVESYKKLSPSNGLKL